MKVFDWVQRKFLQKNHSQATHKVGEGDRSGHHASLADLLALDEFSQVVTNYRRQAGGSASKVVQSSFMVKEEQPCKKKAGKHYIPNEAERGDGDGFVQAVVVSDVKSGLLPIGTVSSLKKLDGFVAQAGKDLTENRYSDRVEVLEELRKELEKVMCNTLSWENTSNDASPKPRVAYLKNKDDIIALGESENKETADIKRRVETKRSKRKCGRKVFPLRDFLEIAHEAASETPVMADKKKKKMSGFRNLLNIESFMCGLYEKNIPHHIIDHDKRDKATSWYDDQPVFHKSQTPQRQNPDERVPAKLTGIKDKLLVGFGKKWGSSQVNYNDRNAAQLKGNKWNEESYGEFEAPGQKDANRINHMMSYDDKKKQEQQAKMGLGYCVKEDRSGGWVHAFKFHVNGDSDADSDIAEEECLCCWPRKDRCSSIHDENRSDEYGHWIKTDKEYVVLEL